MAGDRPLAWWRGPPVADRIRNALDDAGGATANRIRFRDCEEFGWFCLKSREQIDRCRAGREIAGRPSDLISLSFVKESCQFLAIRLPDDRFVPFR
ncbi:hypothetical protein [Rhizobium sp.]